MSLPSECKMPDLSSLYSPLVGRLIVQLWVGEHGLSPKISLYRRNFIRLVDKALNEYHAAREAILEEPVVMTPEEMSRDDRRTDILGFTDHIETCVNAVRRLYKLLERIKAEKGSLGLPRELRRQVETMEGNIVDIRDAIEHVDERIRMDEIAPGRPIMAALGNDRDALVMADEEIKFKDLAMVLSKMHEIAVCLLAI